MPAASKCMTKSIINISAFNTSVRNVSNTKQYKWHTHENNMFTYFGFVVSWILQTDSFPAFLVSTRIWLWRKTITVSSHMYVLLDVSFYLCYLCRLIKPVITAKTFHVWLSGFHFEDIWKASILTEDIYPRLVCYNIFYMGVGVGISEL